MGMAAAAWAMSLPARADLILPSPTTNWTAVTFNSANSYPDYYDDQNTGIPAADIVGTNGAPSLYYKFDGLNTPSLADGLMAFRIRLGSGVESGFNRVVHVGIDANRDGALDLFVSADNSGSKPMVRIFTAGDDLNTSPNTTSIDSQNPTYSYAEGVTNYHYAPVSLSLDPTAISLDLDADGNNDYFLSYLVPFENVVSALALVGIPNIDENSIFRFVAATSTQPNSLNQDLNGPAKKYDGSQTWEQLGAASDEFAADGTVVPEPSTAFFLLLGGALAAVARSASAARR
jgi:hypothetical protein